MKLFNNLKCGYFMLVLISGMFSLLCIECNSQEKVIDPKQLCFEFYKLNKEITFGDLYYMVIPGARQYSEYDSKKNEITIIPVYINIKDTINNTHINLPVFKDGADKTEQERFFARCRVPDIEYLIRKYNLNSFATVSEFYVKEVNSIYSQYNRIKVPKILHQTRIPIEGNGNYIEFILYKNDDKKIKYSCYYVRDTIFSNDNLKNYFKTLPQFDEHWYYKIAPNK